jgi:hypothetical protein
VFQRLDARTRIPRCDQCDDGNVPVGLPESVERSGGGTAGRNIEKDQVGSGFGDQEMEVLAVWECADFYAAGSAAEVFFDPRANNIVVRYDENGFPCLNKKSGGKRLPPPGYFLLFFSFFGASFFFVVAFFTPHVIMFTPFQKPS